MPTIKEKISICLSLKWVEHINIYFPEVMVFLKCDYFVLSYSMEIIKP